MKFVLACLVAFSFILTPVFAHSGDTNYYGQNANKHNSACEQESDKDGTPKNSQPHSCLCVHIAGLPDLAANYIASVTRQGLLPMQDATVTDYNLPPLLEPPSRA